MATLGVAMLTQILHYCRFKYWMGGKEPCTLVRYISPLFIVSCNTVAISRRKPPVTSTAKSPMQVTTEYVS